MITERKDGEHGTELIIYIDERRDPWYSYRVVCMEWDVDVDGKRQPPTARISLLSSTSATIETVERLAREYLFVAGAAAALQAEKRARYAEQFGDK